jgi:signal transduction histidine kinase
VTQEALTNIIRHAQVKTAEVNLTYDGDKVLLQIKDNGVGFVEGEKHPDQTSWGIPGMRERVRSVGGEFEVESNPGGGTRINVTIPIESIQVEEQVER